MNTPRTRTLPRGLAAIALALAACRTTDLSTAYSAHDAGEFEQAAALARKIEPARDHDTIWVLLERGKMLQDAGLWEESTVAFQRADEIIETLDEDAIISFSQLANRGKALMTDDRSLDYEGSGFERILLGTALCVNHLMLGDLETAAVYARRQAIRQRKAQEKYEKQIASLSEREHAAEGEGASVTVESVEGQDDFRAQSDRLSRWTNPAYAGFTVPYGYYVGAIALGAAARYGEQDRMATDLAGMLPEVPAVLDLAGLHGVDQRVFVLLENGRAPVRIDRSFPYISPLGITVVPIPDLRFRTSERARSLRIEWTGGGVQTSSVDEVDALVAIEFKEALPGIWLRNVIAVVLKEVLTKQAEDEIGGWAILAGSIFKATVRPDLRSWTTLPGEHQVAQFERPPDGRLRLRLAGTGVAGRPALEVELPPGPSLVWVRSTAVGNMVVYMAPLSDTPGPARAPGLGTGPGAARTSRPPESSER